MTFVVSLRNKAFSIKQSSFSFAEMFKGLTWFHARVLVSMLSKEKRQQI